MSAFISRLTQTNVLWLLAISATVILFVLNEKSYGIDPTSHEQTLNQIAQIRSEMNLLDETLFETRVGIIQHFDPLNHRVTMLNEKFNHLEQSLSPELQTRFSTEIQELQRVLEDEHQDIEDFKSYYAVLRNSINYFPHAAADYIEEGTSFGLDQHTADIINKLVTNVLGFALTNSQQNHDQIQSHLATLRQHSKTPAQQELLAPLASHTQLILSYKKNIDNLMGRGQAEEELSALNQLRLSYFAYHEQHQAEAAFYRTVLIFFAAILAISVLIVLFYLSKTSQQLRVSLRDLNFQKYALDQHAIVSITDKDGYITYANDKFCEISGYCRDELRGKTHRLIRSDEHSDTYFRELWQTISNGKVWQGEVKNRSKDGGYYWVNSTIVPFIDESGTPFKYVSIRTDITTRKHAEEKISVALEQATQANESKSRFLATITHELRTPLNAVLGMLHLLSEGQLNATQKKQLMTASHSGELLLTLINDVLDFSKMEAGKLEIEMIPFDPATVVEESTVSLGESAYSKGLELICDISQLPHCSILGDPTRLRQILVNLLSNAIKFTTKGEVMLTAEFSGGCAIYRVTDTGIGMDSAQSSTIFKPFEQADNSTTRQYGGTGLGLSICRYLAEAMDGTLTVNSQLGIGTTFTLTLPYQEFKALKNPQEPLQYFSNLQILLVSHCHNSLMMIRQTLKNWGIKQCHYCDEVELVIPFIKESSSSFDFVLIDMDMPKGLGGNLSQHIEQDSEIECQQILLSGLAVDGGNSQHGIWLSKPLIQSELFNAIAGQQPYAGDPTRLRKNNSHYDFSRHHILLAEDNLVNQQVAKALLAKTHVKIDIVDNGLKALHAAQKHDYDLILMDIQMPEMDGYSSTQRIRRLGGRFNDLPIIAMTANAFNSDHQKSLDRGMNAHITKPLNPALLYSTIAQWLNVVPSNADQVSDNNQSNGPQLKSIDIKAMLDKLQLSWETYHHILCTFATSYQSFCKDLQQAIQLSEWQQAHRLAHTLKGSSSNLGASEIAKLALQLEQACAGQLVDSANTALNQLSPKLQQMLDEITALPSETSSQPIKGSITRLGKDDLLEQITKFRQALTLDINQAEELFQTIQESLSGTENQPLVAQISTALSHFDSLSADELSEQLIHTLAHGDSYE